MNSTIDSLQAASKIGLVFAGIVDFFGPLRWLMLLGAALVLLDLRWGMRAAKKRGEVIRLSRAWRRTINKLTDYFCWVVLAGLLGNSFDDLLGIPVIPAAVILFIYRWEIDSCISNWCETQGLPKMKLLSIISEALKLRKGSKELG